MLTLGIFSRTFPRPNLGETLDAVRALGLKHVQLNTPPTEDCHTEFESRGLTLRILSATFNIIHPDAPTRRQGFERFKQLAKAARELGNPVLSVCTGTLDSGNMWRKHPDNGTAEAWREMTKAMAELAAVAEEHEVTIAFEPEQANVVDSADKASELLAVLQSKRVGVLIDAANLLTLATLTQQDHILQSAFERLGKNIVAAHAKEFSHDGTLGNAVLGSGAVNFPLYTSLLRSLGRPLSLVMHGFTEGEAVASARYLRSLL